MGLVITIDTEADMPNRKPLPGTNLKNILAIPRIEDVLRNMA
ncbi:MAG: hypothetical protein ABH829_02920 [archaeon]